MRICSLESLESIAASEWNALVESRNPFLCYEFLRALERHQCVGERTGWLPRHIACFDDNGDLIGAVPMYLKTNSYGEFVFDRSWAEAYRRHGLPYYPKSVSAIPFTPVTGQRLLIAARHRERQAIANAILDHAMDRALRLGCSSVHWLFPDAEDLRLLLTRGWMQRVGCQFHWHNPGYRDFEDFLATLSSKKRKNIRRERRIVHGAGIDIQIIPGNLASESQWHSLHQFYASTFARLGGVATLTLPFFLELATTLGEQILLVLARDGPKDVAGTISLRSDDTLYGRHWGCQAHYDNLHFEACYYQGIEYCIDHGLKRFESGAQGEHKISRGFLPTLTYSAHWLADAGFGSAVADFLRRETSLVYRHVEDLTQSSPYRGETRAS